MWGQWQGGVTVTLNGQDFYGICTLGIDRDQPYHATVAFAATGPASPNAPPDAGALLHTRLVQVDDATGQHERRTDSAYLFNRDFLWRVAGNEIGPLRVLTAPLNAPVEGVDARSIEIFNGVGARVAQGQLYDPGLDHPLLRLPSTETTWRAFREWALNYSRQHTGVLFRGHTSSRKRLMTTFHRRGRRNLLRYHLETLPRLAGDYENSTGDRVNLPDSHDYSRLITLARHHGYPTPVLDWTFSPFVAAYFAFGEFVPEDQDDRFVRVFCLDPDRVAMSIAPSSIIDTRPCLMPMRLTDRGNVRAVAQQSIYLFSNVANVEALMVTLQQEPARPVPFQAGTRVPENIVVWDIPREQRGEALHDLRMMGITGATLFPGMQGFFDAMRERDFERR